MATVVKSMSAEGIEGFEIEVEATTIKGQQQVISIIGLGDQAVKEAGERIQAALEFCGYEIPKEKIIISLAPGNRKKRGQRELIDAIVIAAAGGHNILMIGEPGCGKTMIAQRIPSILPEMSEKEAVEITKIHSIAGLLDSKNGLMKQRPFRAPHHNTSLNALIGGGSYAQPGEVSLSHNGVLFLDELAEFNKSTLDALRQPLEDKKVTISRVNGTNTYPSNFMFVAAMNPCPCGYHPNPRCRCTDYEIIHYRGKISGPILERIDIQKNVRHVDYFDLEDEGKYKTSLELRKVVERARAIQQKRFKNDENVFCNAQMTTSMIQKYCKLDEESTKLLKEASEKSGFSARVIHKLLRLARTVADIDEKDNIEREHIITVL